MPSHLERAVVTLLVGETERLWGKWLPCPAVLSRAAWVFGSCRGPRQGLLGMSTPWGRTGILLPGLSGDLHLLAALPQSLGLGQ